MIVIADTTPLNHLVLIGEQEVLGKLYECVIIPQAVLDELRAPQAPAVVKHWIANRPEWLEVKRATILAGQAWQRTLGSRFGSPRPR